MKASLKFREDHQKPLFKAKVPIDILGFPFVSGVAAGESTELCLNLSTFFESGPSLKVSYRPNDSLNPFSFGLKTGIGRFGSPISATMTMSAEFNPVGSGRNRNPTFFIHFKPQFGDFCVKKVQSSVFTQKIKSPMSDVTSDDDGSVEIIDPPTISNVFLSDSGVFSGQKITILPSPTAVQNLFSDVLVSASTVMPVRNAANLKFRWGLKFPAEGLRKSTAVVSFQKLPHLVMDKISVEHVAGDDSSKSNSPENADVADQWLGFKTQVEAIQAENRLLRTSVEDLRSEIIAGKLIRAPAKSPELKGQVCDGDAKEDLKWP